MHCSAGRCSIVRSFFHAFVLDKSCCNNFSWFLMLSAGNGDFFLYADDDVFQMCVSDGATHTVLRGEVDLLLLVLQFVAASSVRPSRALSPSRTSAESLPVFFFLYLQISSFPLVFSSFLGSWNMSRCVSRDPWILYAYLCSGGMLVCRLPAALVSCCLFSPLSRVVTAALIRSQGLFSFLRATLKTPAPMQ